MGITFENADHRPTLKEIFPNPEKISTIAVIIIGENLGRGWGAKEIEKHPTHLSFLSRMNSIAGGIVAREFIKLGLNVDVYTVGGINTKYSESEQMEKYLTADSRFGELRGKVILENNSYDTSTNAEEMAKKLKGGNYRSITIVAAERHTKRCVNLFKAFGINVDTVFKAEEIYPTDPQIKETTRGRREELVKIWRGSWINLIDILREAVLNAEQFIDKKQEFPRKFSSRRGNR